MTYLERMQRPRWIFLLLPRSWDKCTKNKTRHIIKHVFYVTSLPNIPRPEQQYNGDHTTEPDP